MIRALVLLTMLLAGAGSADDRRTGFQDMSTDLQALQDDPMGNPGLFAVLDGAALWSTPTGAAGKSCATCHGLGEMTGIAARYPAWDDISAQPVDLAGRINLCRTRHQQTTALARETDPLLALTAFVTAQSKGLPISPDPDTRLDPSRAEGARLFFLRMGQLNLSCAHCHDDNAGGKLAAALIPQAHPTGYPQYRIEWETTGSLHRRFGGCLFGVRAEPFADGSAAYIALELYLKSRAAGLLVESPAIRP